MGSGRRRDILVAIFVLFLSCVLLNAQEARISGSIISETTKIVIPDADITLISGTDTIFTKSNYSGHFRLLNLKEGEISISIHAPAYKTRTDYYYLVEGTNYVSVSLESKETELEAATVTSDTPLMRKDGDTTIFYTTALSYLQGDKASVFIYQIPGAVYSNGHLTIDGERVIRTYVNGKLVFGDNPRTAIDKLDAEEIVSIKVYDELSPEDKRKGLNYSKKERVINLITLKEISESIQFFALSSIGFDSAKNEENKTQARYVFAADEGFYSENHRLEATLQKNNLGKDNLSFNNIISMYGPINSHQEYSSVKVSCQKNWNDRIYGNSASAEYSYSNQFTKNHLRTKSDWLYPDKGYYMTSHDTTEYQSRYKIHSFSSSLNLRDTPIKSISFNADASLGEDQYYRNYALANTMNDLAINSENSIHSSVSKPWSVGGSVTWENSDGIDGWFPLVSFGIRTSKDSGESAMIDTLSSSFRKRKLYTTSGKIEKDYNMNFSLSKQLLNNDERTISFLACARSGYYSSNKKQLSFDMIDLAQNADITNSFDYTWSYYYYGVTSDIKYTDKCLYLRFYGNLYQNIQADSEYFPNQLSIRKQYLLPDIYIQGIYDKRLSFSYNISTEAPAIEQVRQRVDELSPLFISMGNPNLIPITTHDVTAGITIPVNNNGSSIRARTRFQLFQNVIVQRINYVTDPTDLILWADYTAEPGTTILSYENAPYQINADAHLVYDKHIKRLRGPFNIDCGINYASIPQYENNTLQFLNSINPKFSVSIQPTIWKKHLRCSIRATTGYINESCNATCLSSALNSSLSVSTDWVFFKQAFAKTAYKLNCYKFISGFGLDNKNSNLSACIGYKFLKGNLIASFAMNDMLNRGFYYQIRSTSNKVTQTWSPSYGRYYLFSLVFRINQNN